MAQGRGFGPPYKSSSLNSLLRLPAVTLPLRSFVAEAYGKPPEIQALACVSLVQTAAEKLIALTRRTAMEMAGLSRDIDPALIRHVYDLHMMRPHVDRDQVAALAAEIARIDAAEFRNQYPAYASDPAGETRKALMALQTTPIHRSRYDSFIEAMVYGERPAFDAALGTVEELVKIVIGRAGGEMG